MAISRSSYSVPVDVLESDLEKLETQEQDSYQALFMLIELVHGEHQSLYQPHKIEDFVAFKRKLLARAMLLKPKDRSLNRANYGRHFSVIHYKRAILNASGPNYRNMAMLAACKDLTAESIYQLVSAIRQHCKDLSSRVKALRTDAAKSKWNNRHMVMVQTRRQAINFADRAGE